MLSPFVFKSFVSRIFFPLSLALWEVFLNILVSTFLSIILCECVCDSFSFLHFGYNETATNANVNSNFQRFHMVLRILYQMIHIFRIQAKSAWIDSQSYIIFFFYKRNGSNKLLSPSVLIMIAQCTKQRKTLVKF